MQLSSLLFTVLCTVASVSSQDISGESTSQIAAQFPACGYSCELPAIAAVGCTDSDFACHCAHDAELQALIIPCLWNSTNCTAADVATFTSLANEICANLTVISNATATPAPVTPTPAPVPTPSPLQFVGAASLPLSSIGLVLAFFGAFMVIL